MRKLEEQIMKILMLLGFKYHHVNSWIHPLENYQQGSAIP